MELLLKIETARQAELAKALMDQWLDPEGGNKIVKGLKEAVRYAKVHAVDPAPPAQSPTPLEQAIAEKSAADAPAVAALTAEPNADPFAALQAGAEPEAPAAEKPKRGRKPKAEAPAPEPEKAEDKPLTLDDIRKASTIALELIGAPVIQEALAKFEAIDKEKNALRMSALAEADYGRYIEFLKKKVNDAAKEWPNA